MWIARKCEDTLRSLFEQFPSVAVTGARQSGKTALVRRVFPEADYISLDLPALAYQAERSGETFLRSRREPLIIDEVQYAPSLFRYVKDLIDKDRRPGRFILTGSQHFHLMQGISESLAGRCGLLDIYNLSAAEVRGAAGFFDENVYLFRGGYPELQANPDLDRHFWYAAYLATYLERDVRNILQVGSLRDFDRFLRAVASRTGQILSYSDLARDVGIAPNTAKKWTSVLQASGQVFLLEPYYRNSSKRLVKSPKIYLCDTGLAAFLLGFESWKGVARHPALGAFWETHVVMEVVKYRASRGKAWPLWFWRTAQGDEVDLLLERDGRFIAFEAKSAEMIDHRDLKGIRAFQRDYGEESLLEGYIPGRVPAPYPLGDRLSAIPASSIHEVLGKLDSP